LVCGITIYPLLFAQLIIPVPGQVFLHVQDEGLVCCQGFVRWADVEFIGIGQVVVSLVCTSWLAGCFHGNISTIFTIEIEINYSFAPVPALAFNNRI